MAHFLSGVCSCPKHTGASPVQRPWTTSPGAYFPSDEVRPGLRRTSPSVFKPVTMPRVQCNADGIGCGQKKIRRERSIIRADCKSVTDDTHSEPNIYSRSASLSSPYLNLTPPAPSARHGASRRCGWPRGCASLATRQHGIKGGRSAPASLRGVPRRPRYAAGFESGIRSCDDWLVLPPCPLASTCAAPLPPQLPHSRLLQPFTENCCQAILPGRCPALTRKKQR